MNSIEVFQNYDGSVTDEEPQLEHAFDNLLEERSKPITDSIIDLLSNDDKLSTMNLQTSHLFKTMTYQYKINSNKLEEYKSLLKELKEIIDDTLESSVNRMKRIGMNCNIITNEIDATFIPYRNASNTFMEKVKLELDTKIFVLELENDTLSRNLNSLRSLILTGINEIIKKEDTEKKMCPVCFDSEVCIALVPCGHTYCKPCSEMDRSRSAKCPQCRSVVNTRVKIYFSV